MLYFSNQRSSTEPEHQHRDFIKRQRTTTKRQQWPQRDTKPHADNMIAWPRSYQWFSVSFSRVSCSVGGGVRGLKHFFVSWLSWCCGAAQHQVTRWNLLSLYPKWVELSELTAGLLVSVRWSDCRRFTFSAQTPTSVTKPHYSRKVWCQTANKTIQMYIWRKTSGSLAHTDVMMLYTLFSQS